MLILYIDRLGSYIERNHALNRWRVTSQKRFARQFPSRAEAERAMHEALADCGQDWHLIAGDIEVRTA